MLGLKEKNWSAIGRLITFVEENKINQTADHSATATATLEKLHVDAPTIPVLGITGTGGAGKSSLTDELVRRYLEQFPERTIAIISVDPSKIKTGGALLGDRIRMNAVNNPRVYMRSLATRGSKSELSAGNKGSH